MLMPQTPMPHTPRTSLAIAMLIALAAFSTVACSTTANDPAPTDTNASGTGSSDAGSSDASNSDAGQPRTNAPDKQAPAAEQRTSDPANSDTQASVGTRDFAMRPGDSVTLTNNGSLRYLSMVNDSRCMPNVQCIWAGNAELSFQWQKPGGGHDTFSLNTSSRGGATEHRLGEQRLTLVSLARGPAPEAKLRVEPGS